MASDYEQLIKALRCKGLSKECDSCGYGYRLCPDSECNDACHVKRILADAAAAIEALQAEVKRLQKKLCVWCAVCPKERRKPEDCELLSKTPLMYGRSDAVNVEAQDG